MLQGLLRDRSRTLCRLGYLVLALCLAPHNSQGQTSVHSVTLAWTDTLNPATGTTYSVYRAAGLCSGTPIFSKIATAIATKTYIDTSVTPGNFCYTVTATFNGVESAQSPSINPTVPAFAVTALSATVQ